MIDTINTRKTDKGYEVTIGEMWTGNRVKLITIEISNHLEEITLNAWNLQETSNLVDPDSWTQRSFTFDADERKTEE
jgi:hypothetical protein